MLQAALNGTRTRAEHTAVPVTPQEIAADVEACLRAGAQEFHVHPRDADGRETLRATVVDALLVHVAPDGMPPVGVTTGAWIEPDQAGRLAEVGRWRRPRYTSVNVSEDGAFEVMRTALAAGVGVEAGVWTVHDAMALVASGLADRMVRILVEPVDPPPDEALAMVEEIHRALDRAGIATPRLQHGDGDSTWLLLEDAVRRGLGTRIGLEDTFWLPDGSRAPDNAGLVAAAVGLGA
jgi:uncharacterized protein (DUF849 family)